MDLIKLISLGNIVSENNTDIVFPPYDELTDKILKSFKTDIYKLLLKNTYPSGDAFMADIAATMIRAGKLIPDTIVNMDMIKKSYQSTQSDQSDKYLYNVACRLSSSVFVNNINNPLSAPLLKDQQFFFISGLNHITCMFKERDLLYEFFDPSYDENSRVNFILPCFARMPDIKVKIATKEHIQAMVSVIWKKKYNVSHDVLCRMWCFYYIKEKLLGVPTAVIINSMLSAPEDALHSLLLRAR